MAASNVPIQESVGAALRFVRANARFVAMVAALGALATTALTAIGASAPLLMIFAALASYFLQAAVYAALTGATLFGASAVRARLLTDTWRVWAAMAIVCFFLLIVFFVVSIPVMMVLLLGPMADHMNDLTAAGGNQAEVLRIFTEFAQSDPLAMALMVSFFAVIWYFLTSRLYVAAPASVDQQRILTFETWKWTRGAALRITAARLMLLLPAYLLVFALTYLVARAVGIDPTGMTNAPSAVSLGSLVYVLVTSFISLFLYTALEAGLSAYLYRGLKPGDATQTPPPQG